MQYIIIKKTAEGGHRVASVLPQTSEEVRQYVEVAWAADARAGRRPSQYELLEMKPLPLDTIEPDEPRQSRAHQH